MPQPDKIDPRILGQRIAESRKARGKTQEEMAEFLGCSRPTYIAIEKGERRAKSEEIIKLAAFLGRKVHDLVRPALLAAGATLDFWKVAMRPGKPLMAGQLDDSLVLGLPGNPVSAFVTAILFLKPAIAALSGAAAVRGQRGPGKA